MSLNSDVEKQNKSVKVDVSEDEHFESENKGNSDMACGSCSKNIQPKGISLSKYILQEGTWPKDGKHILAQYDDKHIIVYQAFKPSIAKFAVENQKFGGPDFSYGRMSWIKTNFLWMMYRCGWASKKDQQRVLAVKISRYGFETILANAYTARLQRDKGLQTYEISVRLQWDPDHSPTYDKLSRKAIQLGLKEEILEKYGNEWVHSITDITDFVKEQKKILDRDGRKELLTPSERVYQVQDYNICSRIDLDVFTGDSMAMGAAGFCQIDGTPEDVNQQNPKKVKNSTGHRKEHEVVTRIEHWTCPRSECSNQNFPTRQRCSRCNTSRSDLTSKGLNSNANGGIQNATGCQVGQKIDEDASGDQSKDEFVVPENLETPPGMIVPKTFEENSIIEKTAKHVASNGIEMEILIKSKHGGNPKLSFLNLHDPLNYYYNHMVKKIKAGKYTPSDLKEDKNPV